MRRFLLLLQRVSQLKGKKVEWEQQRQPKQGESWHTHAQWNTKKSNKFKKRFDEVMQYKRKEKREDEDVLSVGLSKCGHEQHGQDGHR